LSRKRKRREPDHNDGDSNMPEETDPQILVLCVVCHVRYNTTLRAFNARGCACPKCGNSKAQRVDVGTPAEPESTGYEEKTEEE